MEGGEWWWWHKVAERLHRTVPEALQTVSPLEFLRWKLYITQEERAEWKRVRPWAVAAARLNYEVYLLRMTLCCMFAEKGKAPKVDQTVKDFLVGQAVERKPKKVKAKVLSPEQAELARQQATAFHKSRWFGVLGISPTGVPQGTGG